MSQLTLYVNITHAKMKEGYFLAASTKCVHFLELFFSKQTKAEGEWSITLHIYSFVACFSVRHQATSNTFPPVSSSFWWVRCMYAAWSFYILLLPELNVVKVTLLPLFVNILHFFLQIIVIIICPVKPWLHQNVKSTTGSKGVCVIRK